MAETLGSLCDKLTIVKLKQYHTVDEERLSSLQLQQQHLIDEIDEFVSDAITGLIPVKKLTFNANKVFKQEGNEVQEIKGTIGAVVSKLAEINCLLWHEQEKVYDFEKVPGLEKNRVVKQLALLNLKRTKCIDEIDGSFSNIITEKAANNE
ncbi:MAG: hypothetical protein HXX14_11840 [Bacteroidetes bacterium]|nr:hypothetical protein [Bacteroidota bacterium]